MSEPSAIGYNKFQEAGSDDGTFKPEWWDQWSTVPGFTPSTTASAGDLFVLDTTADQKAKLSPGDASDVALGWVLFDVITQAVADNSWRVNDTLRIEDEAFGLVQKMIAVLPKVEGVISRGDPIIASAAAPGGVKAKGADTTHQTLGRAIAAQTGGAGTSVKCLCNLLGARVLTA